MMLEDKKRVRWIVGLGTTHPALMRTLLWRKVIHSTEQKGIN